MSDTVVAFIVLVVCPAVAISVEWVWQAIEGRRR